MRLVPIPPVVLAIALMAAAGANAQTPPTSQSAAAPAAAPLEAWRQKMTDEEKALTAAMEKMPPSLRLLSRRGDLRVFLGNFAGAIADYEGMIAQDPAQDAPHWRLGIAYYFDGRYAKGAAQFEKYHAFDNRDRENGVWKFFCQARGENIEVARKGLLHYTQFDREPFPSVYKMLGGAMRPSEVLEELAAKGLQNESRVVFFAKYYVGVMEFLNGRKKEGHKLVEEAAALFNTETAGQDGPGYMWHCARLQAALFAKEAAR